MIELTIHIVSLTWAIQHIEKLLEHKFCSDYILDLLVFIKDHLLRIDPKKRATCDTIYKRFQELDKQCREDEMYCVEKLKQAPARSRTDTSLIVSIEFPGKPQIKIVAGSRESGQVQIKVEEKRVDRKPSHPPHPRRGSLSASSVPISPSMTPKTNVSRELPFNEDVQMGQDMSRQQGSATFQHNTAEAEEGVEVSPTLCHHIF